LKSTESPKSPAIERVQSTNLDSSVNELGSSRGVESPSGDTLEQNPEHTIILQVTEDFESADLVCKVGDFLIATTSDKPGFYHGRSNRDGVVGLIPESKCRKVSF
jgi:hypothetical protein